MINAITLNGILTVLAAIVPEVTNTNQQLCPEITQGPNISFKYIRNNTVKFSCNEQEGYQLYGQRILLCLHGQWNYEQPVCVKEGCPSLPEIAGLQTYSHPIFHNTVITLACGVGYIREGPPILFCNGDSWSNFIPTCVKLEDEETTCDFEEENCGWSQYHEDKIYWTTGRGPTRTNMTGPQADHTRNDASGTYLYVDKPFYSDQGDKARLLSPIYRENSHDMFFSFYYHMFGEDSGNFSVYIKPETVPVTELNETYLIFFRTGNQGDQWLHGNFSVPQQSSNFQFVFESVMIGNGIYGDVAIDDVSYARCDRAEADIPRWTRRPTSAPSTTAKISTKKPHTSITTQPSTTNTPVQQTQSSNLTSTTYIDLSESEITSKKRFQETTNYTSGTPETTEEGSRSTHSTASNAGMQTGNYTNAGNHSANSSDESVTESLPFKLGIGLVAALCLLFIVIIIILFVRRKMKQGQEDPEVADPLHGTIQLNVVAQRLNDEAQPLNDTSDNDPEQETTV